MSTPAERVQLLVHLMATHRRERQSRGCSGCDWRAPRTMCDTRDPAQTRQRHEAFNRHLALLAVAELDQLPARR